MRISLSGTAMVTTAKRFGLFLGLWAAAQSVLAAPMVVDFGPVDTHRGVKQVWLRFSDDMVALGDDKAPDPAEVVCQGTTELPKGHWLDGKRWVMEFKEPLGDGTACKVKPRELKSLKGEAATVAAPWSFDTGGPRLEFLYDVGALGSAKEEPVLAFLPSAQLDMASLKYLACKVNQNNAPVTILDGAERKAVLKHMASYRLQGREDKWMALRCGSTPWPADANVEIVTDARIASAAHVQNKKDESFKFKVRPVFAGQFSCSRLMATEGCDSRVHPETDVSYREYSPVFYSLEFSERVPADLAKQIKLVTGSGKFYPARVDQGVQAAQSVYFYGDFAEGQKLRLQLPADLHDVDARPISNRDKLLKPVPIAHLPAYAGMPQREGIVPWTPGKNGTWPVATRGLEQQVPVAAWHFTRSDSGDETLLKLFDEASRPISNNKLISDRSDTPYAASLNLLERLGKRVPAMENRAIHPARQSIDFTPLTLDGYGMWLVEADSPAYRALVAQQRALIARQSPSLGMPQQWIDSRFALVQLTNLRAETLISAKGDSLIWITAIDSGEPVAGAPVDLWNWNADGSATKLRTLVSDSEGRVVVPASLNWHNSDARSSMLIAHHGADTLVAEARAGWSRPELPVVHTILDRVLLHPGESVSLQSIIREQTRQGFVVPVLDNQWKLQIFAGHSYGGAKPVHEQVLNWSPAGSAEAGWKIPATAKLGQYSYQVMHGTQVMEHEDFQVEEFRTPAFEADFESNTKWSGALQNVELHGALSYLSGGAAAGQELRIKGSYKIDAPTHINGYQFFNDSPANTKTPVFDDIKLTLDASGHAVASFPAPESAWRLGLQAEMSFADPNGEIKSEQTEIEIWPKKHRVGMSLVQPDGKSEVLAKLLALDEKDEPLVGAQLEVNLLDAKDKAIRVCQLKTDAEGKAECRLGDKLSELADLRAEVKADGASGTALKIGDHVSRRTRKREINTLESGSDKPLIGPALPVHVHSPFLPATLLLTVERQGVQRSLVRKLSKTDEIIELPTSSEDAPSVELRAVLVPTGDAKAVDERNWQDGIEITTNPIRFAPASGNIALTVKPAQDVVLPGSSVAVTVKAKFPDSGKPAAHAHVTLVVVDDALLALKGNYTWDILSAYWRRAGTDVSFNSLDNLIVSSKTLAGATTYFPTAEAALEELWVPEGMGGSLERGTDLRYGTDAYVGSIPAPAPMAAVTGAPMMRRDAPLALNAVSGQHVEITGSNIRRADTEEHVKPRSNFSTLALWRTNVELDEHGEAKVNVPLPDTLTRWYIAAIATSGAARFGMDHGNVTTSQPVQIISGLPQSVRSEDVLAQKLTLRNTTEKPLTLTLTAQASGKRDDNVPGTRDPMPASALIVRGLKLEKRVTLAAGENKVIEWKVAVPDGVTALDWTIAAKDADGHTLDSLVQSQSVTPPVPVTVREAMLLAVDAPQNISIAEPSGAKPGLGGLAVHWQSSLVDAAMDGTRRAMADYPYGCMEQLASKAVVSGEAEAWNKLMAKLPSMIDGQGLVRYFPETPGSEVLTAYLIDIAEAYGLALPQAEEQRMRAALRVALAHEVSREQAEWLDERSRLARRLALQATLAPDLGNVAPIVPAELDKLSTIALVDWLRYVLKQPESAARAKWLDSASEELRSRYDMQGTRLSLRLNPNDNVWWFMWNSDVAQARAALLIERSLASQPRWQGLMPGLVSGVVDRQKGGQWHTTVANAWSGAALQEFAKRNEHGPVDGASFAAFGGKEAKSTWPEPAAALLSWPQQGARGDLALRHEGSGAPWATVQVMAAVDTPQAVSHGLSVQKVIEPLEQKVKGRWSVGDILRVKLIMNSDAKLSWLAVRDPIPSGATIQGKGLKGETEAGHPNGWLWWWRPSSAELGNESYRGYYQFVWSGTWESDYVLRLNNAGTFTLPPTRIEAMYAPEIFGESPNAVMEVGP